MYNEWSMNNVANPPADLRDRALDFAKSILRFCDDLNITPVSRPIVDQLIRSSTSIGANFTEAKDSGSKRDFINKVYISKKEASETLYWLKLIEELAKASDVKALQNECKEIILILQSIINSLKH